MTLNTAPFPLAPKPVPSAPRSRISSLGGYLQLFFLVIALSMLLFSAQTEAYTTFAIIFSAIVLEALPFMLLGTLLGGVVEVFLSRETMIKFLPANKKDGHCHSRNAGNHISCMRMRHCAGGQKVYPKGHAPGGFRGVSAGWSHCKSPGVQLHSCGVFLFMGCGSPQDDSRVGRGSGRGAPCGFGFEPGPGPVAGCP